MGFGYLKFQVLTAENAIAIIDAKISVYYTNGLPIYNTTTDEDGNTPKYKLYAPDIENSLTPDTDKPTSSFCDATIEAEGFLTLYLSQIPIFDTETTVMIENLLPRTDDPGEGDDYITIIPPALDWDDDFEEYNIVPSKEMPDSNDGIRNLDELNFKTYVVDNTLTIPEYITVHLGVPTNTTAPTIRVKFVDYVANVVSGEIYPTWPQNSLEANTHAIASFALNRIYTRWYRSRGYNFDITGSPAYDMIYRRGGVTFENIIRIANGIFNVYARRQGFEDPFFTQFCDGVMAQCNGMKQWGTVDLANKGYSPLEILRYYYRPDMQLVISNNIASINDPYPGVALRRGNSGDAVKVMQNKLNRIRVNFPLIPRIENPNGVFGADTESSVKVFQTAFNMSSDGIIGSSTWNKISFIFLAVTKIADLESEGIRIGIGETPPKVVLKRGDRGPDVLQLQFLLNFISVYYPSVPTVIEDTIFEARTENSVKEFQKYFKLNSDGVVGSSTWNKLYSIYNAATDDVKPPTSIAPPYPGTALRIGSSGANVKLMQTYLNEINKYYRMYPQLTADGKFGQNTHNAVVEFQKNTNLTADGVIGKTTWDTIVSYYIFVTGTNTSTLNYSGTLLRVGSVGLNVFIMQDCLNALSRKFSSMPALLPDGKFGKNTEVSVKAFQLLFNLKSDGIIGEQTWYKIIEEYNKV